MVARSLKFSMKEFFRVISISAHARAGTRTRTRTSRFGTRRRVARDQVIDALLPCGDGDRLPDRAVSARTYDGLQRPSTVSDWIHSWSVGSRVREVVNRSNLRGGGASIPLPNRGRESKRQVYPMG